MEGETTARSDAAGTKLPWVDVAKGLGILLVALGHLTNGDGQSVWLPALAELHYDLYLFHMPLFFFLGGVVLRPRGRGFAGFAQRRARGLLVPYYVFSLYYLLKPVALALAPALGDSFAIEGTQDLATSAFDVLVMGEGLWFLWAYFWGQLLAFLVLRALAGPDDDGAGEGGHVPACALVGVLLVLASQLWWTVGPEVKLPLCLLRGVEAAGYILLGVALRGALARVPRGALVPLALALAVVLALVAHRVMPDLYVTQEYVALFPGGESPSLALAVPQAALMLLLALAGTLAVAFLSLALGECGPLRELGRRSLVLYALSAPSMNLCKLLLFSLAGVDLHDAPFAAQLGVGVLLALVSVLVLVPVERLIRRHLPFLLGRRRER
ncbi:hypothetical protein HMPREF1008_01598 [Olsenella sp. oral taxon 809 str. F0356]|uniref:acyltransferase family protein n=1 Tax=Olsenella sp. oral taxon 809 TaxID=661086 RepID=UPI000231F21C|nr:acyltransferase family protein [Olsenella sp. oral taxon 809]EHF01453.1 hypothetical protein HMPREF1008_01598 [Olsenella sp. oral taxon 809 str. F0356]